MLDNIIVNTNRHFQNEAKSNRTTHYVCITMIMIALETKGQCLFPLTQKLAPINFIKIFLSCLCLVNIYISVRATFFFCFHMPTHFMEFRCQKLTGLELRDFFHSLVTLDQKQKSEIASMVPMPEKKNIYITIKSHCTLFHLMKTFGQTFTNIKISGQKQCS